MDPRGGGPFLDMPPSGSGACRCGLDPSGGTAKDETNMGFEPDYAITNAIAAGLTKIERARGFLDAARLSEDWITAMQNRALVLEAHNTTYIEGTQLTLDQSEKLLAGEDVPEADPDDAQEVLNYRAAFVLVSDQMRNGEPITEDLILEIHRRLVQGVRGDAAMPGLYRHAQNYIINSKTREAVYTPPACELVPGLMKELVQWINDAHEVNPVLVAGLSQFQLVHIHPFCDGNGRTARLLATLVLYKCGYDFKRLFSLSEFYERDRMAYYNAIQNVRDNGMDLTSWLEYFVSGLSTQMREVQERGELVIRRDVMAAKLRLSERQKIALGVALEKGGLTIQDFELVCPGVSRRTLQRELKMMVEQAILRPEGATNRLYYHLGQLEALHV